MSVVAGGKSGAVQVDPVLDLSDEGGAMVGAVRGPAIPCPGRNIVSAATRAGAGFAVDRGLEVGTRVSAPAGGSSEGVRCSLRSKSAGSVPRATALRSAALA